VLLAAVALVGCAAMPEQTTGPTPVPTAPSVGVRVGNTAPNLALANLEGTETSLAGFAGQPVMINFWAVWCGFCRVELPEMQRVYEAYKDRGFVILAVDVQEERLLVQGFADELGLTFPVLLDTKGEVTRSYRVRGLPTSYFVDQNGVILDVQVGPVDAAWMENNLAQVGVE
jgi:thiol-disulfide isomerase/thioredoxin